MKIKENKRRGFTMARTLITLAIVVAAITLPSLVRLYRDPPSLTSATVSKLGGTTGCVYTMSDGTCITQILSPRTGYNPLTYAKCTAQKSELGLSYCHSRNDYYAGAAAACGGRSNLPSQSQLTQLAKDLYGTSSISSSGTTSGLTLDTTEASAFLAASPYRSLSRFYVWSSSEEYRSDLPVLSPVWDFNSTSTRWYYRIRYSDDVLAVCVE